MYTLNRLTGEIETGAPAIDAQYLFDQNQRNMYYERMGLHNRGTYGLLNTDVDLDTGTISAPGQLEDTLPRTPWQLFPGSDIPTEIPSGTETPIGTLPPVPVSPVPSVDDARAIVRNFYLTILGREPDASGWDFWTTIFRNEIENKGISFSDAVSNLRAAFGIAKTADYEKANQPVSLLDSFNSIFNKPQSGTGGQGGGFVVVPQQTDSGSSGTNTKLIVILAVVGIVGAYLIHRYA